MFLSKKLITIINENKYGTSYVSEAIFIDLLLNQDLQKICFIVDIVLKDHFQKHLLI